MADRLEIVDALESLAVHCRLPIMDVDARSRWMQTWCEDLREFQIDAIRSACRTWRQGDSVKFPTPGQLLPLVRAAGKKLDRTEPQSRAWTWPTEDQIARLSLAEQRREYLIMASMTWGKVGPMDDAGVVPHPEYIPLAQAYLADAKRIGEQIARGAQKRADAA